MKDRDNPISEKPKYPVRVKLGNLLGPEGNACVILGRVQEALRLADVGQGEIEQFIQEATAGDYENLLSVVKKWVRARWTR